MSDEVYKTIVASVEPFFFECHVTSEIYLKMLEDNIITQLQEHSAFQTTIWHQDGAPRRYGKIVRWIGRRGTIEWSPRSSNLTLCDFSLWGIIKDRLMTTSNYVKQSAVLCQIVVKCVSTQIENNLNIYVKVLSIFS